MVVGIIAVRAFLGFWDAQSIAFMLSIWSSSASCACPHAFASGYRRACLRVLGGFVVRSMFLALCASCACPSAVLFCCVSCSWLAWALVFFACGKGGGRGRVGVPVFVVWTEVVCSHFCVATCDNVLYTNVCSIYVIHVSHWCGFVLELRRVGFEYRRVAGLSECEHSSYLWCGVMPCCVRGAFQSVMVC